MKVAKLICHLGLGDLIIHSAIAKYLLTKGYDCVYFPTRPCNVNSVRSFFLLTPQVQIYVVNASTSTPGYQDYINATNGLFSDPPAGDIFVTGFNGRVGMDGSLSWAEAAYKQLGIDYGVRFDYCPIAEVVKCYYSTEGLPLINQFVHDDPERAINIKEEFIQPNSVICFAHYSDSSILAYVPFIKRAKKVDIIDGPFLHLVDSLPDVKAKLSYHKYARMGRMWNNVDVPYRYKQWNVI